MYPYCQKCYYPECLVYTHALVALLIQVATPKISILCEHSHSAFLCRMIMTAQIPVSEGGPFHKHCRWVQFVCPARLG